MLKWFVKGIVTNEKPYKKGNEAYFKESEARIATGELYAKDSIKVADSLKFKTPKGKIVYGGGGIMPDVFVAYDTTGVSPFFSSLIRKGAINTYLAQYVNNNRASLKQQYPTFEKYKKEFNFSQAFMDDFFKYAAEDHKIEFNEEEYKESEQLMKLNMKAVFAQSLFDTPQFYEIINDSNEVLTKAVEILNSDQYKNAGLEKGK